MTQSRAVIFANKKVGNKEWDLSTRKLLKFLNWIHDQYFLPILANPDRERCSPKSTSTDSPISCILKPIMESFLLQFFFYEKKTLQEDQFTPRDRKIIELKIGWKSCSFSPAIWHWQIKMKKKYIHDPWNSSFSHQRFVLPTQVYARIQSWTSKMFVVLSLKEYLFQGCYFFMATRYLFQSFASWFISY